VCLEGGRSAYAIDVQRAYLDEARKRLAGSSADADWTIAEWDLILTALADDMMSAGDRVDWIAKRHLLEQYIEAEGAKWGDPIMQSLDLAYHDVDAEAGLYFG